jgi:putative ABC transport system substrate-binding protein
MKPLGLVAADVLVLLSVFDYHQARSERRIVNLPIGRLARMDRRSLLFGPMLILAAPLAAGAQQVPRVPHLGVLRAGSPPDPSIEAFRAALRDLGYVEGKTIVVTQQWAEGRPERLPALAAELVRLRVDVILATQTPAAVAAKHATSVIPIVMTAADPVGSGLVDSLARPGRNITGLTFVLPELDGKRVQLLREVVPHVSRIAILLASDSPAALLRSRESRLAAETLGISMQSVEVAAPFDFASAFAAIKQERAEALLVTAFLATNRQDIKAIVELAAKHRLPTLYDRREAVDAGGLMAYGPSLTDAYRRAAVLVDRILKGAKPADLPVEQPTKFELVINLKTAKALGLTIPPSLLLRADQVIE